jgi:hypothetical protein
MVDTRTDFDARLARIAHGKQYAAGHMRLHVGEREVLVRSLRDLQPGEAKARSVLRNAAYPLSFVAAFGVGMLSLAVSTAVRMALAPPSMQALQTPGDQTQLIGGVIAIATSFGIAQLFRLNSKELGAAQTAGVFAALMTLHNIAFWQPELAAKVFTPAWVEAQQRGAVPDSLMFRGLVVPFHG